MTFESATSEAAGASEEPRLANDLSPVFVPSFRAQLITRRTYNRPKASGGFETWSETVDRVIAHQSWLWERAQGRPLESPQLDELAEFRALVLERRISPAGRTLWLGGTETSRKRESSNFNCSFVRVSTVFDVVDAFWLLLQGCGVGFEPIPGSLNGFTRPVEVEVVRSTRTLEEWESGSRGEETNREFVEDRGRTWRLQVGDSAESWAKAVGKLLTMKRAVERVVLDFSQVRPAGLRLRGYGWISSGDASVSLAFEAIARLLSRRAGVILSRIDILDVMNHLGTTLSSRRSAEIALVPFSDPESEAFALAKRDLDANPHRTMSNNSLVFDTKPSRLELRGLFHLMAEGGGSEPGFVNATEARRRAPWFKGGNPCNEILLGNNGFCNLVETDTAKFIGDDSELERALWIVARANYRQTCVELQDGVLSSSWHELNQYLRLCGVGLTGLVRWLDSRTEESARGALRRLRLAARRGADSMADELGLPRSKAVTTVKPSGTLSKIMDTTEGIHRPLGRYVFNNLNFSVYDPLVGVLKEAGYFVFENPYDATGVVVRVPTEYADVRFDLDSEGRAVDKESAILQLNRYKMLMEEYVEHNASVTISYDPTEVTGIVDWLDSNWNSYVGVSWLYRNDPSKTAADLGYKYLPQEVVTREVFEEYVRGLRPIDIDSGVDFGEGLVGEECATGACPVR